MNWLWLNCCFQQKLLPRCSHCTNCRIKLCLQLQQITHLKRIILPVINSSDRGWNSTCLCYSWTVLWRTVSCPIEVVYKPICISNSTYSLKALVTNILLLLQWRTFLIMLLPETLSILSRNPIFIALYNVVTTFLY